MTGPLIPKTPRLTGKPDVDLVAFSNWARLVHREIEEGQRIPGIADERINARAAAIDPFGTVGPDETAISPTYVQAEIQALQAKVNQIAPLAAKVDALLASLKGSG